MENVKNNTNETLEDFKNHVIMNIETKKTDEGKRRLIDKWRDRFLQDVSRDTRQDVEKLSFPRLLCWKLCDSCVCDVSISAKIV